MLINFIIFFGFLLEILAVSEQQNISFEQQPQQQKESVVQLQPLRQPVSPQPLQKQQQNEPVVEQQRQLQQLNQQISPQPQQQQQQQQQQKKSVVEQNREQQKDFVVYIQKENNQKNYRFRRNTRNLEKYEEYNSLMDLSDDFEKASKFISTPAKNVTVKLYEEDTFNSDDLLATVSADKDGSFEIIGSQSEFNLLRPYLLITHTCPAITSTQKSCNFTTRINIPYDGRPDLRQMFLPFISEGFSEVKCEE